MDVVVLPFRTVAFSVKVGVVAAEEDRGGEDRREGGRIQDGVSLVVMRTRDILENKLTPKIGSACSAAFPEKTRHKRRKPCTVEHPIWRLRCRPLTPRDSFATTVDYPAEEEVESENQRLKEKSIKYNKEYE